MTRKHFERIAKVLAIRVAKNEASDKSLSEKAAIFMEVWHVANALATSFEEDNERFDRKVFLKACGF